MLAAMSATAGAQERGGRSELDRRSERAVLAITWQPAFCETRPRVPECRSQRPGRADVTQFSLHGLWPQAQRGRGRGRGRENYCGVDPRTVRAGRSGWRNLPRLGLDRDVERRLAVAMPGVRSYLHRHEWFKHGTCYGPTPDGYFRDALALLDEVNASPVRALFARNIGRRLETAAIRDAFDRAFGPGAGRRVRVQCRRDGNRQVIVELLLHLQGTIGTKTGQAGRRTNGPTNGLGGLLRAARPVRADCPGGIVDAVGLQ